MASTPLTILVLAVGGNVSQGILKSLARTNRGYRVLGADISALQMGLYTVDRAFVSPWASEPEFLPWLIDVCDRERVHAILSGAEAVLMTLAQHRDEIEAATGARCIVSELRVMEIGDDKFETCRWLTQHGFPSPDLALAGADDGGFALANRVGYPLVAKPRRGGGSRGLFMIENEEDLAYAARKPDYLLQEWVGSDAEEYTVGCFVDSNGLLAPSCCMRRDLLSGTTYRAILGDYPAIRATAESIARALRPLGPCNIQLRMTERGPVCFEINPRFSGSAPIRSHFGYNEAEAALEHFVQGKPVSLPLVTSGIGLRYWNELYPTQAAVDVLEATGSLECPASWSPAAVEAYGMPQRCDAIPPRLSPEP